MSEEPLYESYAYPEATMSSNINLQTDYREITELQKLQDEFPKPIKTPFKSLQ